MPDHDKAKSSHHGTHSDKHHHDTHGASSSHSADHHSEGKHEKHEKKHHSKTKADKADDHHGSKATLDVPGHNVHGGGHKHHEHGHDHKEHHADKHKHHQHKDSDAASALSDKNEHKVLMTIQAVPTDKAGHHDDKHPHKHNDHASAHHGHGHDDKNGHGKHDEKEKHGKDHHAHSGHSHHDSSHGQGHHEKGKDDKEHHGKHGHEHGKDHKDKHSHGHGKEHHHKEHDAKHHSESSHSTNSHHSAHGKHDHPDDHKHKHHDDKHGHDHHGEKHGHHEEKHGHHGHHDKHKDGHHKHGHHGDDDSHGSSHSHGSHHHKHDPHSDTSSHHSHHGHDKKHDHHGKDQHGKHEHGHHGKHEHGHHKDDHHHHHDKHGHGSPHDKGHSRHHNWHHHHSHHHSKHPSKSSHGDEIAHKSSQHAAHLLNNYDCDKLLRDAGYPKLPSLDLTGGGCSMSKPWTPRHVFSGRSRAGSDAGDTPLSTGRNGRSYDATSDHHGGVVERIQESLELEQSRRRHCEKMIACIQSTLLQANEEVTAMAEQSRRREHLLAEKEEKVRAQQLEHCNMESFLRTSLEESNTKTRNVVADYEREKAEWRNCENSYHDKMTELESKIKCMREELRNSKHRLAEYESESHRMQCAVKDAEQELVRFKNTSQSERVHLESSKREYRKRVEELMSELESMKKYAECQERKCHEMEDRFSRTESQLENTLRCKQAAEREVAEQAALQQSTLHELTRSLRTEYEGKMVENDKHHRREIEKITACSSKRTEHELGRVREDIRSEFEEKIARLKVDHKLKESNYEKQVCRMVEKMRQYECKLEGIVRDKEQEVGCYTAKADPCRSYSPTRNWRSAGDKYPDSKWKSSTYGASGEEDSTSRTLKTAKNLLDDDLTSPKRFVIHGSYTPRRSVGGCSPDSGRRSCSLRKGYFS